MVDVTQERECWETCPKGSCQRHQSCMYMNCTFGSRTHPAPDGEPVAYLYERDDGSKDLVLACNGEYACRLIELGATETALFAHPPRNDAVVEALEPFAKAAGIRLCGGDYWTEDKTIQGTDIAFHITFGDLKRAAEVYAALKQGEPR